MHAHKQVKPFTLSDGTKGVTSLTTSQHPTKENTVLFQPSITFQTNKDQKTQLTDVVLVLDVSTSMAFDFAQHRRIKDFTEDTYPEYKFNIIPPAVTTTQGVRQDPFDEIKTPNRCEINLRRESNGFFTYCVIGRCKESEKKNQYQEVINRGVLTDDDLQSLSGMEWGTVIGLLKTDVSRGESISEEIRKIIFKVLIKRKALHKLAPIDVLIKSLINSISKEECRYTIITFAGTADRLLLHGDYATTVKKLSQIHCVGGTNIEAGLKLITKEVLPDHLNGVVVLCTDGCNSSIHQKTATEKAQIAEGDVNRMLEEMSQTFGQKVKIWTLGLGTEYFPLAVEKYARDTGGSFEHLDNPQEITAFFNENAHAIAGVKRIPVELKLSIGGGYEEMTEKSPAGVSAGAPWTELFEKDIHDLGLGALDFKLTYSIKVNGIEETITQVGIFAKTARVLPVIDLHGQRKVANIFRSSEMSKSQKIIALQELLPDFQRFGNHKDFTTAANIQSLLNSMQKKYSTEEDEGVQRRALAQLSQMHATGTTNFFSIPLMKAEKLKYNAYEGTIIIDKMPHRIIDRLFDFADSKLTSQPFVSVDEDKKVMAGTVLTQSFYGLLESRFKKGLLTDKVKKNKEYFAKVIANVLYELQKDDISAIEKHSVSDNFSYTELQDFLSNGMATFREMALVTASVVGRAVQKELLPAGKVHRYRAVSYQLNPHAWTVYDVFKGGLFIIDPLLADRDKNGKLTAKIYNLRDPKDAILAIKAYKDAGFEGILENMFKHYNLPGHPPMSCLTEEAVALEEKRAQEKGVSIEMSDLCPASKKIMREPVILKTKDGRQQLFDNKFVEDDLKRGIHPLTKESLKDALVKKAPGKLKAMWDKISKGAELRQIKSKSRPIVTVVELQAVKLDEELFTQEMTQMLPQFTPGSVIKMKEVPKEVILDADALEKEMITPAPVPVALSATPTSSLASVSLFAVEQKVAKNGLKLNQDLYHAANSSKIVMDTILSLLNQGADPSYRAPRKDAPPSLIRHLIAKSSKFTSENVKAIKLAAGFQPTEDWYLLNWNDCQLLFTSNKDVKTDVSMMGSITRVFAYLDAKEIPHYLKGNEFNARDGYHILLSKEAHDRLQAEIALGRSRLKETGCAHVIVNHLKKYLPDPMDGLPAKEKMIAKDKQKLQERYKMRGDIIEAVYTALHHPKNDIACLEDMQQRLSAITKLDPDFNKFKVVLEQLIESKMKEIATPLELARMNAFSQGRLMLAPLPSSTPLTFKLEGFQPSINMAPKFGGK